jgi:hypothetical protein
MNRHVLAAIASTSGHKTDLATFIYSEFVMLLIAIGATVIGVRLRRRLKENPPVRDPRVPDRHGRQQMEVIKARVVPYFMLFAGITTLITWVGVTIAAIQRGTP